MTSARAAARLPSICPVRTPIRTTATAFRHRERREAGTLVAVGLLMRLCSKDPALKLDCSNVFDPD
jgi:hypothetical protein